MFLQCLGILNIKNPFSAQKLLADKKIEYHQKAVYHGNPIDGEGSLVTFDWGLDFTDFIFKHSGMTTIIYLEIDRKKGLDGEFLEVFISRKADE